MIRKIFFGDTPIKQAYFNNTPLIKKPVIKADFVNQQFQKHGNPTTFNQIFSFSRAGRAWLVTDTGLQEYAIDTPRFADGLLIEEMATNFNTYSILQGTLNENFHVKSGVNEVVDSALGGKKVEFPRGVLSYAYKSGAEVPSETAKNVDLYVSKDNGSGDIDVRWSNSSSDAYTQAMSLNEIHYSPVGVFTVVSSYFIPSSPRLGLVRYDRQNTRDGNILLHAIQTTQLNYSSSLIVTKASPVTRPADYLSLLNITDAKTVSGDWDSTLNLSIVDGQIVHSGYGTIRSIEVF